MSLREEAFLTTTNIESISGLAYGVNRPTKSASNPIAFPAASSSNPNHHSLTVAGATLLPNGDTALAPLGANTGFVGIVPTYARAADGLAFTQPDLDLVNWGGNTDNNVMHPTGLGDVSGGGTSPEKRWSITAHFYHEDTAQWVVMMRGWNVNFGGFLYTSPNPHGPWTLASTVYAYNAGFPSVDPGCIVRRADGRWLSYYQKMSSGYPQTGIPNGYYAGRRRDLGCLLSDSTDLFGTWTDQGVVLACTHASRQYYGATAWRSGDAVCIGAWIFDGTDNVPAADTFNGTINRVHKIALYASHDGLSLTLADDDWLASTGSTSDWDGGEILTNAQPVDVGNESRIYFAADDATHHQDWVAQGNRRHIGMASWGRGRLGKLSGTGHAVGVPWTSGASGAANVFVTSASGAIEVELLDPATGAVLPGYHRADCDPIPTDTFGHPVTWKGSPVTPASFKPKAYVTAGELNRLDIADTGGQAKVDPSNLRWTQAGKSLVVLAFSPNRNACQVVITPSIGGTVVFDGVNASRFSVSADGTTWASSLTVPAGRRTIYVAVTPVQGDTSLKARLVVPS